VPPTATTKPTAPPITGAATIPTPPAGDVTIAKTTAAPTVVPTPDVNPAFPEATVIFAVSLPKFFALLHATLPQKCNAPSETFFLLHFH